MQTREQWLEERRTGIGGSDVAAIMGISPWATPLSVYEAKILPPGEDKYENEAMLWGRLHEETIIKEFERRTGLVVTRGGNDIIRHHSMPWMLATPDGLIGNYEGLEVKTARTANGWGDPESNDVPETYLCQVMHYMIVTGRRVWHIAALIGGSELRCRTVKYNDELAGVIIAACHKFWHEHVLAGVPPLATTVEEARRKWPSATMYGKPAYADDAVRVACERLAKMKAAAVELKSETDKLQALIMDYMGAADQLMSGKETLATWKEQNDTRLDLEALRAEHPDIAAKHTRTTRQRKFLLKVKGGAA